MQRSELKNQSWVAQNTCLTIEWNSHSLGTCLLALGPGLCVVDVIKSRCYWTQEWWVKRQGKNIWNSKHLTSDILHRLAEAHAPKPLRNRYGHLQFEKRGWNNGETSVTRLESHWDSQAKTSDSGKSQTETTRLIPVLGFKLAAKNPRLGSRTQYLGSGSYGRGPSLYPVASMAF